MAQPVMLPEVGGIDPSFFFDEDGKAYIVNNDEARIISLNIADTVLYVYKSLM